MARILLVVALIFVAWFVVRSLAGKRRAPGPRSAQPAPREVEGMAQCAWCGAHVPVGTAVAIPDGRTYCSVQHRDAAGAPPR